MKKIILSSVLISCFSVDAINFFERSLADINFRSHLQRLKKHEILVIPSISFAGQGRSCHGDKVNPLQYLATTQDALAMLKGFPVGSIESQIGQNINIDDDNGMRGHFVINGDLSFESSVFEYSYRFFSEWFLRFRMPVYIARINHTSWVDQTQNLTYDDMLTHQLLTDNFFNNVETFGGLRLTDWSAVGPGDLTTYLHWMRVFLQEKEWLKEVGINARLGVSFPTGKCKNEDQAFSYAFGNDGAFALPFGAGIDLKFKKFLRAGIDVGFEQIFSCTKHRRIMTDLLQTDFLFLQKADARKEYGITQRFNLYLEPQLTDTMVVRIAYQHTKHGHDKLCILNNDFSSITASKAMGLKEWTTHDIFMQFRYDNLGTRGVVSPIFSVFAQIPFNGKRSLDAPTIGFDIAMHF